MQTTKIPRQISAGEFSYYCFFTILPMYTERCLCRNTGMYCILKHNLCIFHHLHRLRTVLHVLLQSAGTYLLRSCIQLPYHHNICIHIFHNISLSRQSHHSSSLSSTGVPHYHILIYCFCHLSCHGVLSRYAPDQAAIL